MKCPDPSRMVFFPLVISVRADTAHMLSQLASDMDSTLDELISAIAEDSVAGLEASRDFFEDVYIPDRCSMNDLLGKLYD